MYWNIPAANSLLFICLVLVVQGLNWTWKRRHVQPIENRASLAVCGRTANIAVRHNPTSPRSRVSSGSAQLGRREFGPYDRRHRQTDLRRAGADRKLSLSLCLACKRCNCASIVRSSRSMAKRNVAIRRVLWIWIFTQLSLGHARCFVSWRCLMNSHFHSAIHIPHKGKR